MKKSFEDKLSRLPGRRSDPPPGGSSGSVSGSVDASTIRRSNIDSRQQNNRSNNSSGSSSPDFIDAASHNRRRRQLTWRNFVEGYEVMSHHAFTDEEHRNSWLTDDDRNASQNLIIRTVRVVRTRVKRGLPIPSCVDDTDELCVRGLEKMHTTTSNQVSRDRKAAMWDAVLDEQERQRMHNAPDRRRISRLAMASSAESLDVAIQQAAKDAEYVNRHVRPRPSTTQARRRRRRFRTNSNDERMAGVEISFQNVNISGSGEEAEGGNAAESGRSLALRRDSLLSTPSNPNAPARQPSSLTTLNDSTSISQNNDSTSNNTSSLNDSVQTNPNEHSDRSLAESTAAGTDGSSSTLGSRSIGSLTLFRQLAQQGRGTNPSRGVGPNNDRRSFS